MRFKVPIRNRVSIQWSHSLWLILLVLSFSLQAGDQVASWRYDQHLIAQGRFWLLFSGHLVHLNWAHWSLNMAGLAIVALFFSAYGNVLQWLCVLAVSALLVGLGLFWQNPEVVTYVGFSGVLHGLFVYGAIRETRIYPASGYALLVLLIAKLLWELMNGALPGSETLISGRIVTDAHLYGALGGALVAGLLALPLGTSDQLGSSRNNNSRQGAEPQEKR